MEQIISWKSENICLILVKWVQQDATIAFFIRNGFTLHVSGDNLTHHQEYNAVYGHRSAGSLRLLLNLSVVK